MIPTVAASEHSADPFAALRFRDFRIFLSGLLLASQSAGMQAFAIGLLAVQLAIRGGTPELGSFYIGLTGLSGIAPGFLGGILSGIAADRFDRRAVIGAASVVQPTVPDALIGRVMGIQVTLTSTGMAFGVLVLGTGGSLLGVSNVFFVAGGVVFLTAVLLGSVPTFRDAGSRDAASTPMTWRDGDLRRDRL